MTGKPSPRFAATVTCLCGISRHAMIAQCRPVIQQVVADVARQNDRQGRIDDYSKLFTQARGPETRRRAT